MDKRNKISIRINGEDTYLERKELEQLPPQDFLNAAQEEHASAIEDWVEEQEKQKQKKHNPNPEETTEDLNVFERAYQLKKKGMNFPSSLKQIMLAGGSAIVIGMVLGFVMLRLFAGLASTESNTMPAYNNDATQVPASENNNATPATGQSSAEKSNSPSSSMVAYSFPAVSAYVVQAGIFSTNEKANIWKQKMEESGMTGFVWPEGDQYYLFTGVGASKAEGDKIASFLKAQEFDSFVKEWSVSARDKKVMNEEGKWMEAGITIWKSMLTTTSGIISKGDGDLGAVVNNINAWKKSIPDMATEQTSSFQNAFNQFIQSVELYQSQKSTVSLWEMQVQLLNIWFEYQAYLAKAS